MMARQQLGEEFFDFFDLKVQHMRLNAFWGLQRQVLICIWVGAAFNIDLDWSYSTKIQMIVAYRNIPATSCLHSQLRAAYRVLRCLPCLPELASRLVA